MVDYEVLKHKVFKRAINNRLLTLIVEYEAL